MDNQEKEEELSPEESLKVISKMLDKVKDDALWKIAKKRSSFKLSLSVYVIINLMLVGLWYFTSGVNSYFWPAWPMFGWGLGIAFQYFDAYLGTGPFSEEREFEKMKRKQNKDSPGQLYQINKNFKFFTNKNQLYANTGTKRRCSLENSKKESRL